ncbi:MAG: large protein [Chitinophagaceae bacterium]|nr:large protein [Chitinophagaceae bacterium]
MERIITRSLFLRFFFLSFLSLALYSQSHAISYTVTSNADTGPGSLRTIIAGASSGDNIYFNAPMTITLLSTLSITQGVNIDATVGVGIGWSAGNNKVTIAGNGSIANGLQLSATGISIKGITFQNYASNCIYVSGATNFNIKSCFFNTNSTGTTANASAISQGVGMYVSGASSGGIIGGPNAGDGNVFYTALTNGTCIHLYNIGGMTASTKIFVQGNKFGTDYTGTVNLGLGTNCSAIQCAYMNYVDIGGLGAGEGNQFDGSASGGRSIYLYGTSGASNISILGNKMGTVAANSYGIAFGTGTYSNITIQGNTINNSTNYGIDMTGATLSSVKVNQNLFSNNTTGAINNTITVPAITSVNTGKIVGTGAGNGGYVEIYKWDGLQSTQGSTYIGSATADGSGNWSSQAFSFTIGDKITVTTTLAVAPNSTSKFSTFATVVACPSTVSAGSDQTICATSPSVNLSGNGVGVTGSPTWTVVSGGGSLSNATTYFPIYTLGTAEQNHTGPGNLTVVLQVSVGTTTCAPTISDQVTITINPKPVVNAGGNQTLCANASGGVALGGTVTNATGGTWTGGSGSFTPNLNTLNATYIPSAGEKASGSVTLTLTSTGNGLCTPINGSKTITITAAPTVNAGPDQTFCANATVSLTAAKTIATGVAWSGGGGSFAPNATSASITYQPTTAEIAAGTVTLTAMTTGNGASCTAVSDNIVLTITASPVVNAGADQSTCTPAGNINLNGSVNNATGGQWMIVSGSGTIANPTSLNTIYIPSASESNATVATTVTFSLLSTGNGSCNSVTDAMTLTITPAPTANAGADLTMCSNSTNILLSGSTTGASTSTWTSSGSGTLANPNMASGAAYTPSAADRTAGSVTLTLTSSGCGSTSDAMVLTIGTCLIDPQLSFESPNLFKSNGDAPFKHNFAPLRSTGAITYAIVTSTSCATISTDGYVTLTCVDNPITIKAFQAASQFYTADTASYTLYIGKAVTHVTLESRGSDLAGGPFQLKATTNYDQPLTYSIVGGDVNAVTITSGGVITPVALGTVFIRATAPGDTNFETAYSNDASVTIYPTLTKPVAVNDTLQMLIAEEKTVRLADNDYGTTASINLSPMLIDIDSENSGLQTKYFKPGIGIFTIDTTGLLTFQAFEAFIGTDSIQYTVTDANGYVSNKASLVLIVTSPVAEIALKANEIITANGDNLNNALVIGYTDLSQGNDLLIVDAAGNKLFYAKDYQNNWTATDSSGRDLGNGVYYFIFREFDHIGTVRRQLKGNFTVIR